MPRPSSRGRAGQARHPTAALEEALLLSSPGPSARMQVGTSAAAALLVLALSACGGAAGDAARQPSPTVRDEDAPPVTSLPTPAPDETSAECEAAPCGGVADTVVVDPATTVFFRSPSDNITCSLSAEQASCEILRHTFAAPPQPADCDLDHGTMVAVGSQGAASFVCHGDTGFVQATPFAPDSPVVGYGSVLRYGDEMTNGVFRCSSSTDGLACSTVAGAHGFELARARYRVY